MGIDYGRNTCANRDPETGIRYGVYSLNNLPDWIWDCLEPVYSPACPACGGSIEGDTDLLDPSEMTLDELAELADELGCVVSNLRDQGTLCPHCHREIDSDAVWDMLDPDYHTLDTPEGIVGRTDRDCTILWVFRSPYTGSGEHCSPCVPGAISEPRIGASGDAEAYCLPDSYFEEL